MESKNESSSLEITKSTTFCEKPDNLLLVQQGNILSSEPKILSRLFIKKKRSVEESQLTLAVIDYREKLKRLDENYDFHLNEIMSDSVHRGDLVSPQRLLGYVDAIMATCATFLVIPLRKIKDVNPGTFLEELLYENRTDFVLFVLGYLVVLTIWESINIRSLFVKRVDDILLFMTMITIFITSLLPFSLSLEGHYSGERIPVWITCSLLALVEFIDLFILLYSMKHPSVLHVELHSWTKAERHKFRNILCLQNIFNIIFFILGSVFILLNYVLAWVFIAMVILMPLFKKILFYIWRRTIFPTKIKKSMFFFHYTKGNIAIDRVTALSDAAYAIIICLLILDITVDQLPTFEHAQEHDLPNELKQMAKDLYIYFAIFVVISILWYSNHGVLYLFKTTNVFIIYMQKISLSLACLIPICGNMVSVFSTNQNQDAKKSILVTSLVIFLSSYFNLWILIYGILTKDKYLYNWATGNIRQNKYQHLYIVLKTSNVPFWSFLCILGSRLPQSIVFYTMCFCVGCTILTFIVLKIIFHRLIGSNKFVWKRNLTISRQKSKILKMKRSDNYSRII